MNSDPSKDVELLSLFQRNLNMPTLESIVNIIKDYDTKIGNGLIANESNKHVIFLYHFRVHECVQFKQHRCSYHKPYTCFFWHFENQRRRFPFDVNLTTIVYQHDNVCKSYNSMTGICKSGSSCKFVHHIYGDMERLFHPFYYKTTKCMYKTDSNGLCKKNSIYCAFSHGPNDFRELKSIYGNYNVFLDISNNLPTTHTKCHINSTINPPEDFPNTTNGDDCRCWSWLDSRYIIKNYKTITCTLDHPLDFDISTCPFYHEARDQRRNPYYFKYEAKKCRYLFQENIWNYKEHCPDSHLCSFSHNNYEYQFHPDNFKKKPCPSLESGKTCAAKTFCPFRHLYKSGKKKETKIPQKSLYSSSSLKSNKNIEVLTSNDNTSEISPTIKVDWSSSNPTTTDQSTQISTSYNTNQLDPDDTKSIFVRNGSNSFPNDIELLINNINNNIYNSISNDNIHTNNIHTNNNIQNSNNFKSTIQESQNMATSQKYLSPGQSCANLLLNKKSVSFGKMNTNIFFDDCIIDKFTHPVVSVDGRPTSRSFTSYDMLEPTVETENVSSSTGELETICNIIDNLNIKIRSHAVIMNALKSSSINRRYSTLKSLSSLKAYINKIFPEEPTKKICLLCIENECDLLFLPCIHLVACSRCFIFDKELRCPLCDCNISETINLRKNLD